MWNVLNLSKKNMFQSSFLRPVKKCQISSIYFRHIFFVHFQAGFFRSEAHVSPTKLFDSTKVSKNVNLKKKAIVTALFKETNPDKIVKGIQDLNKFGVPVKKLSVKWDLRDSCFQVGISKG